MKKALCLLLSIFTCVTLSVSAFAEETKNSFTPDPSGIEPIISGPVERSIFGNDDRETVSDPTMFPYRTIAKLIIYYPNEASPYVGTGFMYGPRSMATAAHNLYDSSKGGYATKITAYFGASSSSTYYAKATASSKSNFKVPSEWIQSANMKYDYGVIVFNSSPNVGSFGMQVVKDHLLDSNQYTICGYPGIAYGDFKNLWKQVRSTGYMTSFTNDYLNFHIDMVSGQSGSPVYGADNKVIGIVTYNGGENIHYEDKSNLENTANRINTTVFNYLMKYRA